MAISRLTVSNAVKMWRLVRGFTGDELRRLQNAPVSLAIAGSQSSRDALKARQGIGESQPVEYDCAQEAIAAGEALVLDAESQQIQSDDGLKSAMDSLAQARPNIRVALAAKYPAFRPIVTEQLTREVAKTNAKIAALSALPGIIPLTDWLMPATSAGDIFMLTRNQINLLLEISACYALPPDPRQRLAELIPVVGGAFGWRAIARELVGFVPGGIGVGVKAGVAYAGTYAVGRAAGAYYAGAKQIDIRKIFEDTVREAVARAHWPPFHQFWARRQSSAPRPPILGA